MGNISANADTPPPAPGALWALVLCLLSVASGCGAYALSRSTSHGLFTAAAWLGWFAVALALAYAAHRWDCAAPRGSWRSSSDAPRGRS